MDRTTKKEAATGRLSRRGVLIGIGVGLTAPVATALTGGPAAAHPRHAQKASNERGKAPSECLSGLIQEGRMTYADLMAR